MGSRRKSREAALQIFFQIDFLSHKETGKTFGTQALKQALAYYWSNNLVAPDVREFAEYLCYGTLEKLVEIDNLIETHSTNWKMSRMAGVDRTILRLATFELMNAVNIPSSVTLNEAVEIAKKYGTDESHSFINGILDKVAKVSNK